jgi:hypothetical protein
MGSGVNVGGGGVTPVCMETWGLGFGTHLALRDLVGVVYLAVGAVYLRPVRADGVGEGGEAVALFKAGGTAMDLEDYAIVDGPDWGRGLECVAGDEADFDLAFVYQI